MSKTGRYSAVQVRANPPGRAKLASKLAGQRGPVRTTQAAIYLQLRVKVRTLFFFTKSSLDTNTPSVWINQSWEHVLSDQWILFIKRQMSCPGTCAVPFLCDFSMTFPMAPLCHPIKKILESPLRGGSSPCPFEVRSYDIVDDKNQYRRSLYAEYAICVGHQLLGGAPSQLLKNKKQTKKTWRAISASAPATARASSLRLNADDHNWWTTMPLKRHQQSGAEKRKKRWKRSPHVGKLNS